MMHIYFYSLQCVQLIWFSSFFAGRSPTTSNFTHGSYRDLNSWKSLCPAIFQTCKTSGKRRWSRKNGKKSWVFIFAKLQEVLYKWIFFSFWSALIQYRPYVWLVMFCYVCMFCCAVRVHCLKTDNTWNTSIIKYLEWHSWTWIKIIMACSNNKLFQLP